MTPQEQTLREAGLQVDRAIVQAILPQLYVVIDDLLDAVGEQNVDKELLIRAKKLLPDWAPHSLAQTPIQGKKRQ